VEVGYRIPQIYAAPIKAPAPATRGAGRFRWRHHTVDCEVNLRIPSFRSPSSVVRSDLQFSPHTDTVAGTCLGRICHSGTLHPLKIADRIYLGRAAPSSTYGAAGALIVLMFWMYCPFLFGAELTKAIADEREPRSAAAARNYSRDREFVL